jgi:hypothetical protein
VVPHHDHHTSNQPCTSNQEQGQKNSWLLLKLQQVLVGLSLLLVSTTAPATSCQAVEQGSPPGLPNTTFD